MKEKGLRRGAENRLAKLALVLMALGAPGAYAVNELGQAVQALGGSQLLVNAADAIYTTCVGLATETDPLTPDQQILGGRCADMTQQGFALAGFTAAVVPAFDTFGLASGPNGTDSYLGLLRQFTGEELSTQGRYATEGALSQFKGLAARLGAIRRGVRGSGLALNLQGLDLMANSELGVSAPARLTGGSAGEAAGDLGFAWFVNLSYGFGDRDATEFENGYDADSFGGVIGLDYGFNDALVAGIALAIDSSEVDFDKSRQGAVEAVSGGDLESDSQTLSLYMNYLTERSYASVIVSYGQSDFDMTRNAVIPLATSPGGISGGLPAEVGVLVSDTESDQYGGQVQVGRTFGQTATTYDLYAGLDFLEVDVDAFAETGSPLGLQFGSQEIESFQGLLGASVRHAINTGVGVVVPFATLEYRHEFDNEGRVLDARYVGTSRAPDEFFQGETDNFEILTDDADEDYFEATVGLVMQLGNNVALYGQFSSLVGLKDTTASQVTIGLRGTF